MSDAGCWRFPVRHAAAGVAFAIGNVLNTELMGGSPYIYDPVSKEFVPREKQDGGAAPVGSKRSTSMPGAGPSAVPPTRAKATPRSRLGEWLLGPGADEPSTAAVRRDPVPPTRIKRVMWSVCGVLFAAWLAMVVVWMWRASREARENRESLLTSEVDPRAIVVPQQNRPPEKPIRDNVLED